MKKIILIILLIMVGCQSVPEKRHHHELRLQPNIVAIVSEGWLEPHRIGSYSIVIYEVFSEKHPYDNYVTRILSKRDGIIQSLQGVDITGYGGYISAYAYKNRQLKLVAKVHDLSPDDQVIDALVSAYSATTSNRKRAR